MLRTTLVSKFLDASARGYTEQVEFCIQRGVDIHVYNDQAVALAAKNGHEETVQLLCDYGANVKDSMALHWAASHNRKNVVPVLLKNGADKDKLPKSLQQKLGL